MLSGCIIDCFVDFVVFKTRYELKKKFNIFRIQCTKLFHYTLHIVNKRY